MFLQVSVCPQGRRAWQGGCAWWWGGGKCGGGMCGRGGVCMAGGMCDRGYMWQGQGVGMHGRGDMYAGEVVTEAGGTHHTGMHSC